MLDLDFLDFGVGFDVHVRNHGKHGSLILLDRLGLHILHPSFLETGNTLVSLAFYLPCISFCFCFLSNVLFIIYVPIKDEDPVSQICGRQPKCTNS